MSRRRRGRRHKKKRKEDKVVNPYNIRKVKRNIKTQKDMDNKKKIEEDKLKLELGEFDKNARDYKYKIEDKEYEVSGLGWIILDSFWNNLSNSQKHTVNTAHGQKVLRYVRDMIEVDK